MCLVGLAAWEHAHPPGFTLLGFVSGVGVLFLVAGIAAFIVAGRSHHHTR